MIEGMSPDHYRDVYAIYCHYVQTSNAIFDRTPKSLEAFAKDLSHSLFACVAKHEEKVIGYGYVHPAFEKEAYDACVEVTIYFQEGPHYGLADPLMDTLIQKCQQADLKWMIACITDTNTSSIAFHRKHGFVQTGQLPSCGLKENTWNGVIWMAKHLQETTNIRIAHNATVVGDVTLEDNVNIWYQAVIRGDLDSVSIGANTNIQDLCMIHTDIGYPVSIGQNVTVGHGAIIHGATIEDEVLVGMGAILMNGCHIGSHSIIGAGALVKEGMQVPQGSIVVGNPAKVIKQVTDQQIEDIRESASHYVQAAKEGLL